jgi:hypothetical protein
MANSANVGNSHIFMIGLVVSCWLLVVSCWLLVVSCWLLVVSCWLLVVSCWLLNLFLFLISDDKCHQILAQIPYSKPLYEDFMTKRSPQP